MGALLGDLKVDGHLDEPDWRSAPSIADLTMIEPTPGGTPTGRTEVMVPGQRPSDRDRVRCFDPAPDRIVSFTKERDGEGWTAEIRIPVFSINFARGLTGWGFNVQRRIQRNQETGRWAAASNDIKIYQTSRAGWARDSNELLVKAQYAWRR